MNLHTKPEKNKDIVHFYQGPLSESLIVHAMEISQYLS